jgi:hypothetical protein
MEQEIARAVNGGGGSMSAIVVLGVVWAMVEVIKWLIKQKDKKVNSCGLNSNEHEWIKDLHNWHSLTDIDGVKNWYIPNNMKRQVAKTRDLAEDQLKALEETNKLLNKIVTVLGE